MFKLIDNSCKFAKEGIRTHDLLINGMYLERKQHIVSERNEREDVDRGGISKTYSQITN